MTKREENKILVRERLLKEALRLFSAKGLQATTVADIVTASGIGRGTFYNYFADVKSIFDAVIDQLNADIPRVIKKARKGSATIYDLLYRSFKAYFDFVSQPDFFDFHLKNQSYIRSTSYGSTILKMILTDLQQDLGKLKNTSDFKSKKEFKMLSFVLVSTSAELFLNTHASKLDISNHEMATFLANLYTNGLEKK